MADILILSLLLFSEMEACVFKYYVGKHFTYKLRINSTLEREIGVLRVRILEHLYCDFLG
jgi:hypothetical protein